MDATYGASTSKVDIFARPDEQRVAKMIYRHLMWWKGPEDNMVSWTSSLLFALVYMFHLRANSRDGSTFASIYLCIIDTTSYPTAVFLRDMDLIRCYRHLDEDLQGFESLRSRKHGDRSGYYYFGEYVSQGSLKIEGKCGIATAQAIIDQGLYDLLPEFQEYAEWKQEPHPPWANATICLRENFYREGRQGITKEGIQAAINIAQFLEQRWKLPIAVNFISLVPHRSNDTDILAAFRGAPFTDDDRSNCSPFKAKFVIYDTLPEVQECASIMQSLHKDYCLQKLKAGQNLSEPPRVSLRHTILFTLTENLGAKNSTPAIQDLALPDVSYEAVLSKLSTISLLSKSLRDELKHKTEAADLIS